MANLETIKKAPDVVVMHRYANGRLVETEYKSQLLGMAVERNTQIKEPINGGTGEDPLETPEDKPKRR